MIGRYLCELSSSLVKDLAVHVHQQGYGAMARGDQVEPRRDALGIVLGDTLEFMRWLGPCEIADGAQLLDQVGLARRSGAGTRRWESPLAISSVRLTVGATTEPARKPAEDDDGEDARCV